MDTATSQIVTVQRLYGGLPRSRMGVRGQSLLTRSITTLVLAAGGAVILLPLAYMLSISLRDRGQVRQGSLDLIPFTQLQTEVNGKMEPVYTVNMDGQSKQMALVKKAPGGKG